MDVKVVSYRTVPGSMFAKATTFYRIKIKADIPQMYKRDTVFDVERRFNDFKLLHEKLSADIRY
jgi:hypothetical protein